MSEGRLTRVVGAMAAVTGLRDARPNELVRNGVKKLFRELAPASIELALLGAKKEVEQDYHREPGILHGDHEALGLPVVCHPDGEVDVTREARRCTG